MATAAGEAVLRRRSDGLAVTGELHRHMEAQDWLHLSDEMIEWLDPMSEVATLDIEETVTHALQAALAAAGLPRLRFHDLRHSAATFLIAAGIPLKHVSDLLGHSTIVITADIYGRLLDESNAAAGKALAQTLFGAR